jgi:hypothetical protein
MSDGSLRSRGFALSENYVNPGSLRSAHFATYAERQESGLTQVADSEFEDAGDADGEYEDAGMDDQPASGRLHDFCYVSRRSHSSPRRPPGMWSAHSGGRTECTQGSSGGLLTRIERSSMLA